MNAGRPKDFEKRKRILDAAKILFLECGYHGCSMNKIAQKVGEEGVETALAAVAQDDAALLGEVADLLYHLGVLLRARGLSLGDARRVLAARRG